MSDRTSPLPATGARIGAWTNPTNVRGPVVSAKYAFTPKLSLNADDESYKAAYGHNRQRHADQLAAAAERPPVNRYQVGLGYGLSSAYGVDLGYENVQYDLRNNSGSSAAWRAPASRTRPTSPSAWATRSATTPPSSCCTRSSTTTTRAPASTPVRNRQQRQVRRQRRGRVSSS